MTSKIVLREVDEFLADFVATYSPIMPGFLVGGSQYTMEVGKINFRRLQTDGNLDAMLLSPKDTEMTQIQSRESKKIFSKYFLGAQYVQSQLQDRQGYEVVLAETLNHLNLQNDKLFMFGGGTQPSDVINNGLFYSQDANYTLKTSYEVLAGSTSDHLKDLYSKIIQVYNEADEVNGQKTVLVYGSTMINKYSGIFAESSVPFLRTLQEALPGVRIEKMPTSLTPAGQNGFMVVNVPQIKVHYTVIPQIISQGVNDEKLHAWTNFALGSSMVDVKAKDGIVKQPLTFA